MTDKDTTAEPVFADVIDVPPKAAEPPTLDPIADPTEWDLVLLNAKIIAGRWFDEGTVVGKLTVNFGLNPHLVCSKEVGHSIVIRKA